MWFLRREPPSMIPPEAALPGRATPLVVPERHAVLGGPLAPPPDAPVAWFGMGCFWGAERRFWKTPGVITTAAGYQGGYTPNPTYDEVCTGRTGHTEVVQVAWDPAKTSLEALLRVFWEAHDPTQGMRQGNDVGTQYRSALYVREADLPAARASRDRYQAGLTAVGLGGITTEVAVAPAFYYAEPYHQQYLHHHPDGYCGLRGTGVRCAD